MYVRDLALAPNGDLWVASLAGLFRFDTRRGRVRLHLGAEALGGMAVLAVHTPREREVLEQLVEDTPEVDIAEALGVSPHTVRSHVKNLYAKWRCTAGRRPSAPPSSRASCERSRPGRRRPNRPRRCYALMAWP